MSIKADIMEALLPHCDVFTAGAEADRIIAEAKELPPGKTGKWHLTGTGVVIELKKGKR